MIRNRQAVEQLFLCTRYRNEDHRFFDAVGITAQDAVEARFVMNGIGTVEFAWVRLFEDMEFTVGHKIEDLSAIAFNAHMTTQYTTKPFGFCFLVGLQRFGAVQEMHFR